MQVIFQQGNLISRMKNSYLADFTTGIQRIPVESGGGGSGGGAGSPVHQTVKIPFDSLKAADIPFRIPPAFFIFLI
jgi:hypothetical protein